ncbi:MAG: zinc-dependent metalloprotease [Pseudomonadota bacterium]|nr:zinc-dependent metalloprotease [Pseudomonadota bacterium]
MFYRLNWLAAALALSASAMLAVADETGADSIAPEDTEDEAETYAEVIEGDAVFEGLFTFYRDRETGETTLRIAPEQFEDEYIYFAHIEDGVVDAGSFRGAYGPRFVFTLERRFDKVAIVRENTAFYFDPDNAISRASEANIARAVLAVQEVVAEDQETGAILIEADSLFLSESWTQLSPSRDPDADPSREFTVGEFDAEKSQILGVRSYPLNTDIEVEYVFHNPKPLVYGSDAVTDPRNISVKVLHSLIEMPENDYQPRFADPRLGSFNQRVTDLTSAESAPFRDVINRWHLVKKDPSAALSDPVEPITWWIENTTPVEWRPLIQSAALEWNKAFEKAGFSNAVAVKIQPDDADWDAGDLRYNVLRWTSSPNPPFGGYGPSFANPRTGQLLGADIMLEYSFLNRSTLTRELIQGEIADQTNQFLWPEMHTCAVNNVLGMGTAFAQSGLTLSGADIGLQEQLLRDRMHYLILHEIGHTLGMNHNMKATQILSREQVQDPAVLQSGILAGSVMDYPAVNYAPTEEEQTLFYTIAPGPYDDWYIEWAYSPGVADPEQEAVRLDAIASRSAEPELAFGNDADDMRYPGTGLDPRVNIYDLSSDSIGYAASQMALMQVTLNKMASWTPDTGRSYQEAVDGASLIIRLWSISAGVISRWIGGVYVDRAMAGQEGGGEPLIPVERDQQKRAMAMLSEHLFAPDAFSVNGQLWRRTAPERRGFDHGSSTEDPKIHQAVLAGQKRVLDHLMHPVVLKRIVDTELYGNEYPLHEMLSDLTAVVFEADESTSVNAFRRNLQSEYVERLGGMIAGGESDAFDSSAQAIAIYELDRVAAMLGEREAPDTQTKAHVRYLARKIEAILDPSLRG